MTAMQIREVKAGDDGLGDIERALGERHGTSLAAFGAGHGATVVLGGFVGRAVVAFGLFQDYRDPRLHVGSRLDPARLRDVLELREVGLYQIALLHADEGAVPLREAAAELVQRFEELLRARFDRYCLFITLMQQANQRALPLYESLGFKRVGPASCLMRFDLDRLAWLVDRAPPLPSALVPRFLDEAADEERRGFAECYRQVFLSGAALDLPDLLATVTAAPGFSAELSLLLLTRRERRVVGFMLASSPGRGRMHVDVAGLLPELRGQRLPFRCFPPIARRALDLGLDHATFVTTQPRVARLTLRAFGARELDRLETHLKAG